MSWCASSLYFTHPSIASLTLIDQYLLSILCRHNSLFHIYRNPLSKYECQTLLQEQYDMDTLYICNTRLFSFPRLLEPSLSSFLAFLKVGIVVSVWLATPPLRKSAVLTVCWIYICQKLRQLLVTHSPDAVSICNRLYPVRAVFVITFIDLITNLHRASPARTLSHNYSPFGG